MRQLFHAPALLLATSSTALRYGSKAKRIRVSLRPQDPGFSSPLGPNDNHVGAHDMSAETVALEEPSIQQPVTPDAVSRDVDARKAFREKVLAQIGKVMGDGNVDRPTCSRPGDDRRMPW